MNSMFWKKNASTILTCLGAAGVVVTSVLTAKGVTKAEILMEDRENRIWRHGEKLEPLTKREEIMTVIPAYIPAIISGAATIACILGANILNKYQQASLISAYTLLNSSYTEYKKKVAELYGEDANNRVQEEVVRDRYESTEIDIPDEECLFFDFAALRYFTAPMSDVIQKTTMDDGMECYIISTPFGDPMNPEW